LIKGGIKMKYWAISLENFEGDVNEILYFKNYEIAKKNFDIICNFYKNYDEFEIRDNCWLSFFDANYNEYSTYVHLFEKEIIIHDEILFE
jgi:hypothetical protein